MKSSDEIREIQQQLKGKGVKYCLGAYVDIHGVPKGKVVPIDHLEHMAHGSPRCRTSTTLFRSRGSRRSPGCRRTTAFTASPIR